MEKLLSKYRKQRQKSLDAIHSINIQIGYNRNNNVSNSELHLEQRIYQSQVNILDKVICDFINEFESLLESKRYGELISHDTDERIHKSINNSLIDELIAEIKNEPLKNKSNGNQDNIF